MRSMGNSGKRAIREHGKKRKRDSDQRPRYYVVLCRSASRVGASSQARHLLLKSARVKEVDVHSLVAEHRPKPSCVAIAKSHVSFSERDRSISAAVVRPSTAGPLSYPEVSHVGVSSSTSKLLA